MNNIYCLLIKKFRGKSYKKGFFLQKNRKKTLFFTKISKNMLFWFDNETPYNTVDSFF